MSSFTDKPANTWSKQESIDWVNSLTTPVKVKQGFIAGMEENNLYGAALVTFCEEVGDLLDMEFDGMTKRAAPGIVAAFNRHQTARTLADEEVIRAKNVAAEKAAAVVKAALFAAALAAGDKSKCEKFTVFVTNAKKTEIIKGMTSAHTVQDLISIYSDISGDTNVALIGASGTLIPSKTLAHYEIKNQDAFTVTFKAKGGTTDPNSNSNSSNSNTNNIGKRRKINYKKYPTLKTLRTRKPDCLFGYTRALGYHVIEMPCGHAMESNSMFSYIKSKFEHNNARIKIDCPMTKCTVIWDWQLCCHIAVMSDEEYIKYSALRNKRSREDIRDCPHCKRVNERKPGVAILRMACVCAKGDWCWVCAKPWRGSGLMMCRNKECSFMNDRNRTLATCPMSIPYGWETVKVELPDVRACPHCLEFMTKTSMCKHMKCSKCEYNFCFSCLELGDKKNYPKCKVGDVHSQSYSGVCKAAERQQFQ